MGFGQLPVLRRLPRQVCGRAGGGGERDGPAEPPRPGRPGAKGHGRAVSPGAARTAGAADGSRARTIGLAAAGVVVIAALAVIAYTLLSGHSGHSSAATGSSPGLSKLPSPSASGSLGTSGASRLGKWGYITSRATDAAPLTVAELYPAQFLITGSSFVRTTDRADTNCDQALFGTQLQNAAKVYGCSQVVRASYISGGQTMMGTVGVVNLSSANDAAKAGERLRGQQLCHPAERQDRADPQPDPGDRRRAGRVQGPLPDPDLGGVHQPQGTHDRGPAESSWSSSRPVSFPVAPTSL